VGKSAGANHLLSEQIDQEQGCVALRAVTAQTHGTGKELAVWAAPLADEAFTATLALVDSPRHHRAPTLELLSEALQIGRAALMTQAEGALLMGA